MLPGLLVESSFNLTRLVVTREAFIDIRHLCTMHNCALSGHISNPFTCRDSEAGPKPICRDHLEHPSNDSIINTERATNNNNNN